MNRQALLRCAKLARAAADNATICASFANIRPHKDADWKALTRAALMEALAELDKAEPQVAPPTDWFAVAADLTGARAIEAARSDGPCGRCFGSGAITTIEDELDECPDCQGSGEAARSEPKQEAA